jgi:hypothetical protein
MWWVLISFVVANTVSEYMYSGVAQTFLNNLEGSISAVGPLLHHHLLATVNSFRCAIVNYG